MKGNNRIVALAALLLAATGVAQGQSSVSEDFTTTSTSNSWWFFNGACLTASTSTGVEPTATGAGTLPGCTTIGSSYYNKTGGEVLVGGWNGVAGGTTQTLPDPVGRGALRFTNGAPYGFSENGAIVSTAPFSTGQGVSVTFKTITYRGNSGGIGAGFTYNDGADGISFYLLDASKLDTTSITGTANGDGNGIGSWGGSLGYSCSNSNPPYNGLVGAYLGLGIDEYGNFLNGVNLVTGYTGTNTPSGDNSAYGYGRHPNRIGLRGAGNIAWNWLNANYPNVYKSTFTAAVQQTAVQETCQKGVLWDEASNHAVDASDNHVNSSNQVPLYDYPPIPAAYSELPATNKIANESALSRQTATPIFYQLKISQSGLLSLSYSINGGSYQPVITRQNITTANGPLPANFLFGFAGSTGGATNIHEILCFKADPATTSASSAGASEKQSAKIESGTQAFFAYYNPSGWTGRVTATGLTTDSYGDVVLAPTPNWDASCLLTGVAAGKTCTGTGAAGPIAAANPVTRAIITWSGSGGIPLEWTNLTSGEQGAIDAGDTTPLNGTRVNYLRGDRSNEINTSGVGLYRSRTDILADIIDSSPTWIGPPNATFPNVWSDRINGAGSYPENAVGVQNYATYMSNAQTRTNVVYVGSNDGLLHGFRSGSFDSSHNFVATLNDGAEVLAYMPGAVVQSAVAASLQQNIHSTTPNIDYASAQYGHNFFVDATPGTGDLFYGNQWHSWVVGGLGPGGSAIYALDVTDPSSFSESNAANLVKGEWTPATITCVNVANCGANLGNTYGTPQLRRLHDGRWAAIFGNGFGSASGDAGIYIMTFDPSSAAPTFYYISTGCAAAGTCGTSNPNGIAFASPADLDADHITDYVYAGDLQGNVWRFDLTSSVESNWAVTPGPLFTTPSGQPITTAVVVGAGSPSAGMPAQIMVLFATGQKTPLSNTSPATYQTGTQSMYGVWDWNMTAWNALGSVTYASMSASATGLSTTNQALAASNLQQQTVLVNTTTQDREIPTPATICWAGTSGCSGTAGRFGWFLNFPGTQEQVVYSPQLVAEALTVNSIVPAPIDPTSCATNTDSGFTYVLSALTGTAFYQVFLPSSVANNPAYNMNAAYTDTTAIGMQTNATGSSFDVRNSSGENFLVHQCISGVNCPPTGVNIPTNSSGRRISWIERR
jgi:type IV pilus assembly protein PilY1